MKKVVLLKKDLSDNLNGLQIYKIRECVKRVEFEPKNPYFK